MPTFRHQQQHIRHRRRICTRTPLNLRGHRHGSQDEISTPCCSDRRPKLECKLTGLPLPYQEKTPRRGYRLTGLLSQLHVRIRNPEYNPIDLLSPQLAPMPKTTYNLHIVLKCIPAFRPTCRASSRLRLPSCTVNINRHRIRTINSFITHLQHRDMQITSSCHSRTLTIPQSQHHRRKMF